MGFLSRQNTLISILAIVLSISTSGCGLKRVRADSPKSEQPAAASAQAGASGEMGPPLPPQGAPGLPNVQEPIGPSPGPGYVPPKDGYVLVLGPGLARGLAYIGVIRELEEHQLSINAIVGVEIGAVVSGIWASSNTNALEWEMHKFNRDTLLDYPLLGLHSAAAPGKKLYAFLDEALKVNLLQKMKIPTLIASTAHGDNGDEQVIESNGSAKDIIRGAMGIPGILKAFVVDGKDRTTAAVETPFPVAQAKALGVGKTICVDVVGRGNNFSPKEGAEQHLATLMRSISSVARQQLKDCEVVLSVATDGISYLNFDAKADLIYKGRQAVKKWLGDNK